MKTEIKIKTVFGNLIFSYEKENNSIEETLLEAIKKGADLYGADLRGADLFGANLRRADLYGADLRGADLREADLYGANLRRANLRGADLYGADLYGADLYGADLYGADLYGADLRGADLREADLYGANLREANLYGAKNINESYIPMFCKWSVCFFENKIKIGCKIKTIEEWDEFFAGNEIYDTERNTEDFRRIEAVYLAHKAYYEFLNK